MKNKLKKLFSLTLSALMMTSVIGTSTVRATGSTDTYGGIGNEFVNAKIGVDGSFSIGLAGDTSENWYKIIYGWPDYTGTSFSTLRIDGTDILYGSSPGSFVVLPTNNEDNTANESVWRSEDIAVKQVLQTAVNPATGIPDAMEIRYTITNAGQTNHDVGLRVMLDTMLWGNDSAPFKVPTGNGMESINYEKDFIRNEVPDFWQAFYDFDNPDISSQYTLRGNRVSTPDRVTIAKWGQITGTLWDYNITAGSYTGDSAVGMWWNPVTLAPGETKTIISYYGKSGIGGTSTLITSGPNRLPYNQWSRNNFTIASYLNNNTTETLNNVRFEISTDLTLVNSDANHIKGDLAPGANLSTNWELKATTPGIHRANVNVFEEGETEPFATAEYQVEVLPPPVPENVVLTGNYGTNNEGTPVAGRTTPLTITTSFNDPQPQSVTMKATDSTGDIYTANMDFVNNIGSASGTSQWSHTFIPSSHGLWEAPLRIEIIPHYANSDGTPLQFNVVLIDPSGYIYNSEKGESWRLPGAEVTLQYYDPITETWVKMSDEAYPGRLSPTLNPQITNNEGKYGWDVAEGKYRMLVKRNGFETIASREVTIPPAVLDLNVAMTPTDRVAPELTSNITNGSTHTEPVTVELNTSDSDSGLYYFTYKLDNGEQHRINAASTSFNITQVGSHIVSYTAVDYAGNVKEGTLTFNIADPTPQVPSKYGFEYRVPGNIEPLKDTQINISFKTTTQGNFGYNNVHFEFKAEGAGNVIFKAKDSEGKDYSFTNAGTWGTPGFNLPANYEATTPFILNFSKPGSYRVTFKLVDSNNNTIDSIENTQTITVIAPEPPADVNIIQQGIYRARQVGDRVHIERNVSEANLGDYDSDNDGWALVGRTNGAGENGKLTSFFIKDNIPYAIVKAYTVQQGWHYRIVTPPTLEKVIIGQTRITPVVSSFKLSDNDEPALSQGLYRARQVGDRVHIERNVAEANLSDYDSDNDGWALVGRTNGAGENGKLRGFFILNETPYAVVRAYTVQQGWHFRIITPPSLEQVKKGQTRITPVINIFKD